MENQAQFSKEPQKSYGHNWKKFIPLYIIVGLILYGGIYYVLSKEKSKPYAPAAVAPSASQTSLSPTTVMQKEGSANVAADQEDAKRQAEGFYAEWLAPQKYVSQESYKENYVARIDNLAKEGYITQKAAAQLKDRNIQYDIATCSQNALPLDRYKFSIPTINGTSAEMTVTGIYSPPPSEKVITLDLIKSNSQWSIDVFHCPPPPTVTQ